MSKWRVPYVRHPNDYQSTNGHDDGGFHANNSSSSAPPDRFILGSPVVGQDMFGDFKSEMTSQVDDNGHGLAPPQVHTSATTPPQPSGNPSLNDLASRYTFPLAREYSHQNIPASPTPAGRGIRRNYYDETCSPIGPARIIPAAEYDNLIRGLEYFKTLATNETHEKIRLANELQRAKQTANRLRAEREQSSGENAELRDKIKALQAKSIVSSHCGTPSPKSYQALPNSHARAESLLSLASTSTKVDNDAVSFNSDGDTITSGGTSPPFPNFKDDIVMLLKRFFNRSILWSQRYATKPIPKMNVMRFSQNENDARFLEAIIRFSRTENRLGATDDVMSSIRTRPLFLAGIINERLTNFLGPNAVGDFQCPEKPRLRVIKSELLQVPRPSGTVHHQLLVEQAKLYSAITVNDSPYWKWHDQRVTHVTESLWELMLPVLQLDDAKSALEELKKIVGEAFRVGITLLTRPRDWAIEFPAKGDRYMPATMVQLDDSFAQEDLIANNGFSFTVRFGVSPSVVEKDFTAGVLRTGECHRRNVVVYYNNNPRVHNGKFAGVNWSSSTHPPRRNR